MVTHHRSSKSGGSAPGRKPRGATRSADLVTKEDEARHIPDPGSAQDPIGQPALACAGCGQPGRIAAVVWSKSAAAALPPVLTLAPGWGDVGRSALLCPSCHRAFRQPRRRRSRAPAGGLL
jgi:hypothetical protein